MESKIAFRLEMSLKIHVNEYSNEYFLESFIKSKNIVSYNGTTTTNQPRNKANELKTSLCACLAKKKVITMKIQKNVDLKIYRKFNEVALRTNFAKNISHITGAAWDEAMILFIQYYGELSDLEDIGEKRYLPNGEEERSKLFKG